MYIQKLLFKKIRKKLTDEFFVMIGVYRTSISIFSSSHVL